MRQDAVSLLTFIGLEGIGSSSQSLKSQLDKKAVKISRTVQSSSSSAREDYGDLPLDAMHEHYSRELIVNHGDFPWRDIELLEGDRQAYFCEISEFTPNRPDVTLHRGGKDGQTVGACHYRQSRSFTCGVGSDDISMRWTKMQRPGVFKFRVFDFEWEGKTYTMRKAETADYGGTGLQRLRLTHFKVVDNASGAIIGLFISDFAGKKRGTLKIADGVSDDLAILIILGTMSWRSKISRNARFAAAAAGGGGGG